MLRPCTGAQRRGWVARILAASFEQGRLAAAADSSTAGIRQSDACALRRFQYGFSDSHRKLAAGHFESDSRHQTHCRGDESGQQCGLDTQESTMSLWKQPTDLARINAWSANTMMQALD